MMADPKMKARHRTRHSTPRRALAGDSSSAMGFSAPLPPGPNAVWDGRVLARVVLRRERVGLVCLASMGVK
jgi:hypothetical protein